MRTLIRLVVTAALLAIGAPALATEETTVSALIADSAGFDDTEVVVEGELIGDYGYRDDGWVWTQLNDDVYAREPLRESRQAAGGNIGIGIRIPTSLAAGLDPPGGYRNRGPLVRVSGTWRYHTVERQGESFLEVGSIEILEPGRPLNEDVNWWTIGVGLVLVAGAGAIHLSGKAQ